MKENKFLIKLINDHSNVFYNLKLWIKNNNFKVRS